MTFLRRRRFVVGETPVIDLQPLEFDDHARVLVRFSDHEPIAVLDRSAPRGADVECECGRASYRGHLVRHIVEWMHAARLEVVDLLMHRIGQADVVATFGRDEVATTLRIISAVTGRPV